MQTVSGKLVKGKCGCQGCIYEDKDECPADDKIEGLNACSDGDESMIFVEEDKDE